MARQRFNGQPVRKKVLPSENFHISAGEFLENPLCVVITIIISPPICFVSSIRARLLLQSSASPSATANQLAAVE